MSSVSASKAADSIDHSLVDIDSPGQPKRPNLGVETKNDGLAINFEELNQRLESVKGSEPEAIKVKDRDIGVEEVDSEMNSPPNKKES